MIGPLDDLTVVIKTFRRPASLAASIEVLHRSWPGVSEVLVLDDGGPEHRVPPDARYRLLLAEEGIGLSEGRNRLVAATRTPLVAVFDDDIQVGPDARLDLLAAVVRRGACDLAAAAVREPAGCWQGGWLVERVDRELRKRHAAHRAELVDLPGGTTELYFVDQVNNTFVARTDFVRAVGWDPALRLREHDDFALRSSAAGRIAFAPDAVVDHAPERPDGYRAAREDTQRFHARFLAKWDLDRVVKQPGWDVHSPVVPRPPVTPAPAPRTRGGLRRPAGTPADTTP